MTCNVDSNPPPDKITWSKDGQTLTGSDKTLTLTAVSQGDLGIYTCSVSNRFRGQTHSRDFNVTLVTRGPPHPPTSLLVTMVTSVSCDVSWVGGFGGGYDEVWYEMRVGERGWERVEGTERQLTNLQPDTRYNIQIKAVNKHGGRSESDVLQEAITTKGKASDMGLSCQYAAARL